MKTFAAMALAALWACTGSVTEPGPGDPPPTGPVLEALALVPPALLLTVGDSAQVAAEGTLTDDSVEDMTGAVVWRSNNDAVATVVGGWVEAEGVGTAMVTAEHVATGVSATCNVQVVAAEVTGVVVVPATLSIAHGRTQALNATASLSDGSDTDVTSAVIWDTTDADFVTVTAAGVIEAIAEGEADIEASLDVYTGRAEITVTPAEVASITLLPASLEVPKGRSDTMDALATLTDGTGPVEITDFTVWESSAPSVARIDDAGVVTGVVEGNATITVTHVATGVEQTAPVSVTAAELDRIDVTPSNATVGLDRFVAYTATGVYSDDSSQVLSTGIDWDTLDSDVASVDSSGVVYGVAWGSTTVTATDVATSVVGSTVVTIAYAAEGATDAPVTITPPYVGQVDTTSSYYVVHGLTPGLIYTVSVNGNDDIDLFVHDDLFVTRVCTSGSFGNQESCDAMAPASGSLYIEISGFGADTNPGALFTITLSAGVAAPDLTIVLTAVNGNGSMVSFDYTITNEGLGTVDLFGVALAFWATRGAPPAPGVMGDHPAFAPSATLGPGQSHSASAGPFGSAVSSGTAYATVDYSGTVSESDDDNNVSPGFVW